MNRVSTLVVGLICLCLPIRSASGQSQENWCGTAHKMMFLKYRIEDMVKREADSTSTMKTKTPTLVVEVHDQAICERATRAYYKDRLGPYPADGVAVVRFGDRYGVYGDIHGGEWTLLRIYNLTFETIGGLWS